MYTKKSLAENNRLVTRVGGRIPVTVGAHVRLAVDMKFAIHIHRFRRSCYLRTPATSLKCRALLCIPLDTRISQIICTWDVICC